MCEESTDVAETLGLGKKVYWVGGIRGEALSVFLVEERKVKDLKLEKSFLSCNPGVVVLILVGSVILLCNKCIVLR